MGCFGRGGLRFERMSGADARSGPLVGAVQLGVPVGVGVYVPRWVLAIWVDRMGDEAEASGGGRAA